MGDRGGRGGARSRDASWIGDRRPPLWWGWGCRVSRAPNHQTRRRLLLVGLIVAYFEVVGRGFTLQALAPGRWSGRAVDQKGKQVNVPARRGTIYDCNGDRLAVSRISYRSY